MIRPATLDDIPAIARVHVDSWRTTYRGIVPDQYLDQMSYEQSEARWQKWLAIKGNYHHIFVAQDQTGEVIGFANGGAERTQLPTCWGEVYAIYILQAYQRQGYGRQLAGAIASQLKQSGFASTLVWALINNPACKFYQALGGQPIRQQRINIGGKDLIEIAFGWADIQVLIDKALVQKNTNDRPIQN
ncbi:MAG: GNAT family N-acetyltransferase [Oculatellaceae cyanobacterium bins.114]|nr:GNAT family N-acetyltransferase [Oculatellaceae cyanobacterium bins.114]